MPVAESSKKYGRLWNHFWTFIWLRWRIRANQLSHSSSIGKAIAAIFWTGTVFSTGFVFIASFVLGVFVPRFMPRETYFLAWDAIVMILGFAWLLHVISDLQRSDAVTMDRILQLPIQLSQAFAVNYASSLWNLSFLCISSICFGFTLGSCFSIGPRALLLMLPLVATLAAMTALTYQFQGWLATIMSNPRKRQWVIFMLPVIIIALTQIPTIIATRAANQFQSKKDAPPAIAPPMVVPTEKLPNPEFPISDSVQLTPNNQAASEHAEPPSPALLETEPNQIPPSPALPHPDSKSSTTKDESSTATATEAAANESSGDDLERRTRNIQKLTDAMILINLCVPPLWLASSAQSIVQGTLHFLWQSIALLAVAYWSLRRNYLQSLRYYRGELTEKQFRRKRLAVPSETVRESTDATKVRLIEWRLPWVDEATSAVIAMTWQSMKRAPEVKMYFLIPFIFPLVLFGALNSIRVSGAHEMKACLTVGAVGFALLISSGMMANVFGYDRTGFRSYVLSPIPRTKILLGKNLAMLPLLLLQVFILSVGIGLFARIPWTTILASTILSTSLVPLFVLLFNWMSLLAPFPIAQGSIQPKHFDLLPVLMSMLLSMIMPLIAVFGMLPLGLEWLGRWVWSWNEGIPFAFILSWLWLGASVMLYRWLLPMQGKLFAKREQEVLRVVTSRLE